MPLSKNIELSIVIVNFHSEVYLDKCVSSIVDNTSCINYEIIIIDNGSAMRFEEIKNKSRNVRIIYNNKNIGFSAGCNKGIYQSNGEYILLLNPDTIILNNALYKMVKYLNNKNEIGIIGPRVLESDGKTIQLSCRSFPSFMTSVFNRYSIVTKYFPQNRWSKKYLLTNHDHSDTFEVDWVSGCCMLIRKKLIDELGVLDENYFMYNEDVDICYRAKKNGWKIFYYTDAAILHHIGISSNSIKERIIFERHKSMWRFYKKFYSKYFIFDMFVFLGILIRGIFIFLIFKSKF